MRAERKETIDDLERTSCDNLFHAFYGAYHENLDEDTTHYQRRRCSPVSLVSRNVRCNVDIHGCFLERGSVKR